MTPSALAAHLDFGRLVAEEPFSLYGEQLLLGGFSAWPAPYRRRFPGLRTWHGVSALKAALRKLLGAPARFPLHLASRSAVLMQMAARVMFRRCRRVLTTDLSWPAYQEIVEREARSTGSAVVTVPLRAAILRQGISAHEVVDMTAATFSAQRCDGLFLPAVDHMGIRVPVAGIVHRISRCNELRFTVVDAAQAFCHVPLGDIVPICDILLAGCHKWLQAYHPLGLACFGRPQTRGYIEAELAREFDQTLPPDPLLHFVTQLENGKLTRFSETVPLLPLLTAAGATADALSTDGNVATTLYSQVLQNDRLAAIAEEAGWRAIRPVKDMRSGILMIQAVSREARRDQPEQFCRRLLRANIIATTYDDGRVRLSLPSHGLHDDDWRQIIRGLRRTGTAEGRGRSTSKILPTVATVPGQIERCPAE